ncbi:hypothetical protein F5Y15DRAFT_218484 [Xylariaceae sp. FL0016]|nr:hypothetical protein F5Y15DRAFT_218484 [Xylariaceae sp. FL0016]
MANLTKPVLQALRNVDDSYSVSTMSTCDSKSYDTIFSRPEQPTSSHTANHTSPSHSRCSSPIRSPGQTMERDSYVTQGIGMCFDMYRLNTPFPSSLETSQHWQSSKDINLVSFDEAYQCHPLEASRLGDPETETFDQDPPFPKHSMTPPDTCMAVEDSVEGHDDADIDLERSAKESLARWFGVNLKALYRPSRIISTFEDAKWQCEGIIREEGFTPLSDEDDQEYDTSPDTPNTEIEPLDASEEYQSGESRSSQMHTPGVYEFGQGNGSDRKLVTDSEPGTNSPPECRVRTRGPYNKKRRVPGELSCPFRKRNPLRFNVRDHEACANKSYGDVFQLKKHLLSCHLKISVTCSRCQRRFPTPRHTQEHMQQCPDPLPLIPHTMEATNPEDGFGQEIEWRLRDRRKAYAVQDWETIYVLLFPNETVPSSDFIAVIEHHEVRDTYERGMRKELEDDFERLDSRTHPLLGFVQTQLTGAMRNIFQRWFDRLLELSAPSSQQPRQIQSIVLHQPQPVAEDEPFRDISRLGMTGHSTEAIVGGSDTQTEAFSTPQYMSPGSSRSQATTQLQIQTNESIDSSGPLQHSRASENIP